MMKLKKFLGAVLSLSLFISLGAPLTQNISAAETQSAVAKKSSSGSKKSSGSKGNSKNTSKNNTRKNNTGKKSSGKKNTTQKSSNKRRTTSITHKQYTPPAEVAQNDSLTLMINSGVIDWVPANLNPGGLRINSVKPNPDNKSTKISLNENFTYLPVSAEFIKDMKKHIRNLMPDSIADYDLNLMVGDKGYSYYITKVDKLPEKYRNNPVFVAPAEPYVKATKGMQGDIVALWASHGRYYKTGTGKWFWQRPQLFQVAEDTHTMSYILPYVVPMIENAGGYVMMPRERDLNAEEVIVDNDTNDGGMLFSQTTYFETEGSKKWETGELEGFIYDLPDFRDTENPFENGTYRQTSSIKSGKPSIASWHADIPKDGEYAVYVSYKTVPNSVEDAHYTVNYSGGSKDFIVNQTMGGGTWIYLGTFPLEEGYDEEIPVVSLSNLSKAEGKIVTADAVKIGGGMGNIARSDKRSDVYVDPSTPADDLLENISEDDEDDEEMIKEVIANSSSGYNPVFSTSGLPRFLEGARYWMHWAGFPEYVYSPFHGKDDYKDDYTSRGHCVNYLAGGSRVLPDKDGLNIPVDVSMALHSDAGKRNDDSYIGTLGIYYTNGGDVYYDGTPRSNSRTLTDMLMRQITMDIRQYWEPEWKRRSMWDKSYLEARVPEVPTSLIEFMSHQNFADMRLALDPAFRFTVGRSIYKALGRFIAERKDRKFIVQPLPVKNFAITRQKAGIYKLTWEWTKDPLEETAKPEKYIILERTGDDLGFHKLGETSNTSFDVKVKDNLIHSFQVIAANDGGVSFPSETLAFREGDKNSTPVMIINGFTRISGPESYATSDQAGFLSEKDFGVPYIQDISFIGFQTEYNRGAGDNFGKSNGDYATAVIAGNTFDYPYLHGNAFKATGAGFVSASIGAVENGTVNLSNYKIVDLIMGKQKTTRTANADAARFTAFPSKVQTALQNFIKNGGNLIVSGTDYVSDLFDYRSPNGSRDFAMNVLGTSVGEGPKASSGDLYVSTELIGMNSNSRNIRYCNNLNRDQYIVQYPDFLNPTNGNSSVFMKFSDTGMPAGIINKNGKGRAVVMTVPIESLNPGAQGELMTALIKMLQK